MRELLRSRKFTVVRRAVETADGGLRDVDFIRHPGAVVILPLLSDDEVVMIRNHRHSINRELLEIPAGTLDVVGESTEAAAHRELEEETGYRAKRLSRVCEFYPSPGILDERMTVYVASELTRTAPRLEPTERITTRIVNADEAVAMALDGRIEDGKTIVSLLRWHHQRRVSR